jgi:acetyl-CoA carboxylase biotin carboxylase subunit
MFQKVLIANRGEIAVRVARACRELGIETVAVYSDVDRDGLHVRYADEAHHIGPAPSTQSYLKMETVIDVAHRTGAEAVHPGYGFLAENADFARRCREEGLVYVGPTPEATALMGDKASARRVASESGVPIVPGSEELTDDPEKVQEAADQIGFPLLVKAVAGGGGKGMRVVQTPEELPGLLAQARSEAGSSFGNPSVYLERFLSRPRHVEFQIIADAEGNVVHLLERECSIQRRHQKLIEECPSPLLDDELRTRMGEAAVGVARRSGYLNAGTVEFLVDQERNFYFLEMNARLQVEHPVTEMVTGLDLVKLQLHVAAGDPLPLGQKDVTPRGWAMEFRITAEDPYQNFLPCPGKIDFLRPAGGPGIRDDSGVYAGWEVTPDYDPLIAKLIVWGEDRNGCIARARRAIREYRVDGISTTLPFFDRVLTDPDFVGGEMDTYYVDRRWKGGVHQAGADSLDTARGRAAMAAAALTAYRKKPSTSLKQARSSEGSGWKSAGRREQLWSRL